jgi:hypothetical protein
MARACGRVQTDLDGRRLRHFLISYTGRSCAREIS